MTGFIQNNGRASVAGTAVVHRSAVTATILLGSALLCLLLMNGCASSSASTKEKTMMSAPVLSSASPALIRCGELYAMHCQRCHDLPVASQYSEEKWKRIMPAMARKAKIDAMTQDSIAGFVFAARSEGK
jgi:hypothetical protein